MPAHFTHIYTGRAVADYLAAGAVMQNWASRAGYRVSEQFRAPIRPVYYKRIVKAWPELMPIGAIAPRPVLLRLRLQ
jgi:hypothetical protein